MGSGITVTDVLGRGGVLSRRLEGFRERPQQLEMARAAARAFREGGTLLAEAPTGVGKSLAYLVPALLELVDRGRRVVVSTHTIALQEQLLNSDLPLLGGCLPVEFVALKAVGRGNYLSRRRLADALTHAPTLLSGDRQAQRLQLLAGWAERSTEGTLQDLGERPGDVWDLVRSEADNCLGRRCPTYGTCFFHEARRRLESAHVIVANHALYFSDLRLREEDAGVLPDHDALILDEAHHVEHVAAEHFGLDVSRRMLEHYLSRLSARGRGLGVLHRLRNGPHGGAVALVDDLRGAVREFFGGVEAWLARNPAARMREPGVVRDVLSGPLLELARLLAEEVTPADEREAVELESQVLRARGLGESVRALLAVDDPGLVYFVEQDPGGRDTALVARPLEVAPILEERLFQRLPTVVLTSATLGVGPGEDGLGYAAGRLGCGDAERLVLGSPFRFEERVEVHVPASLPLPDEEGYPRAAAEAIAAYVRRTRGGAFVLFTSYRSLEAVHGLLAGPLGAEGYSVLKQGGSLDRRRMLELFRGDGNAVLFGTDSFWEGVDVPGPPLRLVVLARLPFPVPTLPLNAARAEELRKRGRNPFREFSLPEALIRFRQGFGRLIRTEEDEGLVVCLDRRVLERAYGRWFQVAVPSCPWITAPPPGRPAPGP